MTTRSKPRPGSLPRLKETSIDADWQQPHEAQSAIPPFMTVEEVRQYEKERDQVLTALAAARKQVERLSGQLRNGAFTDWVRRCAVMADVPSEWTQARTLYEDYLRHVKLYGRNRAHKMLSSEEAATETQWGRMMATLFPKKRRTVGWYYPLRLKRGA